MVMTPGQALAKLVAWLMQPEEHTASDCSAMALIWACSGLVQAAAADVSAELHAPALQIKLYKLAGLSALAGLSKSHAAIAAE